MGKKRGSGGGDLLLKDMIGILVRLPIVSLLRFKTVCKSWIALIESSSFTDLYFNSSSSSSNFNKFGSFILHAAVDSEKFREDALFMFSSSSEYRSARYVSWCSKSLGLWSTGFNGICGKCECHWNSGSSGNGWQWSTNDGRCHSCGKWNNNISGKELSNDDEQQLQLQLVLKLGNLGFPSCYNFGKPPIVMVVGSCNGIICLYDKQSNEVSLWNPATRQFRILPKPTTTIVVGAAGGGDGNVHRLFAFDFDDEIKDYKVVLLSVSNRRMLDFVIKDDPTAPMECICKVEVYSSSTDSWKLLKGITSLPAFPFPYPPDSYSSELFYLNGSCFFMAKLLYSEEEEEQCIPPPKHDNRFMISLDLTNESITPIKLPIHHYLHQLFLCYLGKKIALFRKQWAYKDEVDGVNDSTCSSWENFYIYVLNEEQQFSSVVCVGDEPWGYLSRFEIKKFGLPGEMYIPRGISNDGVFVMLETQIRGGLGNKKKMKLYNLVTKEVKENFLSCDQVLSKAFAYKPSLVSFPYKAAAAAADMVIGKAAECSIQPIIID